MNKVILIVVVSLITMNIFAHSGRTNKDGCHNNHKDGSYHCH